MAWDIQIYPASPAITASDITFLYNGVTKVATSVTSSGTPSRTAVVNCVGHGVPNGGLVTIAGATQAEYNGNYVITRIDDNNFSYPMTISASKKAYVMQGFRTNRQINERDTASFRCIPGYSPFLREEVLMYDGATLVFHGLVWSRKSAGGAFSPYFTDVECVGAGVIADWVSMPLAFITPENKTLLWLLQNIASNLQNGMNVTLHNTADGPTIPPVSWSGKKISDCLRELTGHTGWFWRIDPDLELRMEAPGTTAAAFALEDGSPNSLTVDWTETSEKYANKILALCGDGSDEWEETVGATGADSTVETYYRYWTTLYTTSSDESKAWPRTVTVTGHPEVSGSVTWGTPYPIPVDPPMWCWDYVNHRLRYDSKSGTRPEFQASWVIEPVTYIAKYPMLIIRPATDPVKPIVESHVTLPQKDYASAVQVIDQMLVSLRRRARRLNFTTRNSGLNPGESLFVNLTARGISSAYFLIEAVSVAVTSDSFCVYTVDALEQAGAGDGGATSTYQGSPLMVFRQMLGAAAVPTSSISSSSSSTTTTFNSPAFLGGSRSTSLVTGAATYLPVPNWIAVVAPGTITVTLRVWIWTRNANIGVTARVTEGADGITYGTVVATPSTLSGAASQTPTERSALVSLTAGKYYRLEVACNTAAEGVFAIGSLEPV